MQNKGHLYCVIHFVFVCREVIHNSRENLLTQSPHSRLHVAIMKLLCHGEDIMSVLVLRQRLTPKYGQGWFSQ